MTRTARTTALLGLLTLAGGCAALEGGGTAGAHWPASDRDQGRAGALPSSGDGLVPLSEDFGQATLSGFWVPLLAVTPDVDEKEPGGDIRIRADIQDGHGWGVRIGGSQLSKEPGLHHDFGGIFIWTRHNERSRGGHVETETFLVEYLLHSPVNEGPVQFVVGAGAGAGGVVVDFAGQYEDTGGLAGHLRGYLGIDILEHVEARAGGGGYVWGYPSETVAYGGYFTIGGCVKLP